MWTARICARPSLSGGGTAMRRSKRPGRSSAGVEDLRPVGRAQHDHRDVGLEAVHLREDLVERLLALVVAAAERRCPCARERPIASSSSMKMIAGAASLACLKRSRTREAPMPTIASTNSDAEMEKNGTPASPATARASSVLPVPGRAGEQHAARDPAAEPLVALRVARKSTISVSSAFGSSMPATSANVTFWSPPSTRRARDCGRSCQRAHRPAGAAGAAGEEHEEADQQDHRAEAEDQAGEDAAALVDRLRLDQDALVLEQLRELVASWRRAGSPSSKFLSGALRPRT